METSAHQPRPGPFSPAGLAGRAVYHVVRGFIRVVLFRWLRLRVDGRERLRVDGPVILSPVHRSHLDGPLVGALLDRPMRSLGKDSLFRPPPLGWFMRAVRVFPVRRGTADLDAMRLALRMLDDGEAMVVFPEGTRQEGDEVAEIFDGAAWLAARSGAPVVPVGLAGTAEALPSGAKFVRRTRVAVFVGERLDPPSGADGGPTRRADLRAWSDELRETLQQCQHEARRMLEE
ncbi:MAG TPA: 1-acyl-sn-glycerol-3-phosphate acyltransferase [Acidimicrobiaceae bacterium]|nr:1-acyl-sn-glycerol-3-phosphate acyltransferase [Acidimicrobiaceae bacterium]HCB36969.1 1-acyl-sn-glycerol-3-phosphate acyltransferase [Acidimicrobiaceae bacterium]